MSKAKAKMEIVPWLSSIVKKRKTKNDTQPKTNTPKSKGTAPIVTPLVNWLNVGKDDRNIRRKRLPLSVPKIAYKSTVTGYHDDVRNPAPGDLIMSTAEQMSHLAFTMKESISGAFILFGKVKHFQ